MILKIWMKAHEGNKTSIYQGINLCPKTNLCLTYRKHNLLDHVKCLDNIFFPQQSELFTTSFYNMVHYKVWGKIDINPFPNKRWFLPVCSTSVLKTLWEKEKLLVTSNFSFSHGVFYLFGKLSAIFNQFEIVLCKLFQF